MITNRFEPDAMTLLSELGERKYLNAEERGRFYRACKTIADRRERSFVELMFWSGARISEALALTLMRVNVSDGFIVIKTLKQHGVKKGRTFRIIPLPRGFMRRLDRAHGITRSDLSDPRRRTRRLWPFGRQKGWRLIKRVMRRAGVSGIKATPRGLRHTFGVHCILNNVPQPRLQEFMGHSDIRTTAIYVRLVAAEDRKIMSGFWRIELGET